MADPDRIVLYAAVAATSVGALLAGALALGLPWARLARAAGLVLEAIGVSVLFFAANLVAGVAFVIGMRLVAGVFISVYAMDDLVLPLLSAGQALVFQAWRATGPHRADR
jgi:hypothetical protein